MTWVVIVFTALQLYNPGKEKFCCFRCDGKVVNENKVRRGGGVGIMVPNYLSPKNSK